jgi:hypothetical protein
MREALQSVSFERWSAIGGVMVGEGIRGMCDMGVQWCDRGGSEQVARVVDDRRPMWRDERASGCRAGPTKKIISDFLITQISVFGSRKLLER